MTLNGCFPQKERKRIQVRKWKEKFKIKQDSLFIYFLNGKQKLPSQYFNPAKNCYSKTAIIFYYLCLECLVPFETSIGISLLVIFRHC